MKIAVTGSHGFVGSGLVAQLRAQGDAVVPIVRGPGGAGEVSWDPEAGTIDAAGLEGLDAVVHLAGAGVADRRWSPAYKRTIVDSRVSGTTTLATALAGLSDKPAVLISASAVGYYGERGDQVLDEGASVGTGFLADVCRQWEAATAPAEGAGIGVVTVRNGVVLSASGGALKKQLLPFRLGLGARLGSGRQYFSWISRTDHLAALNFLLHHDVRGPVNLTAPGVVTNAEFTRALGRALHRPAVLGVPAAALRLAAGREMADEFFLVSQRVEPAQLLSHGFTFAHPTLAEALPAALTDILPPPP
jgi:uncharacterized protein (TIGR01777 family)